jgi:hypothetical protein
VSRIVDKKRGHCEKRHVGAWKVKWDNGSSTVKYSLLKFVVISVPFQRMPTIKTRFRVYQNICPNKTKTHKKGGEGEKSYVVVIRLGCFQ